MSNLPISSMRLELLHLQSAQRRAHILFLTQGLALGLMALGPMVLVEHLLVPAHGGWAFFDTAIGAATAIAALHAYLVRDYGIALRWSFVAIAGLMLALLVARALPNPDVITGLLILASFTAMLLAIHATRPSVRAGIIEAIEKNAEARLARTRAARSAAEDHRQQHRT